MINYLPRLWQVALLLATKFDSIRNLLLATLMIFQLASYAATKTSTKNGSWSDVTAWSPAGVPAITDAVIIRGGHTITVNGAYTCADLSIGNTVVSNSTLRITASGNSLTVTGALAINPNNNNNTYTLDAGPGVINVAGTFSTWSTTGTNTIKVGTGTLNFTPAITIASVKQNISFTAAGTANFFAGLTDNAGKLVTFTGCTVNLYNHYTVATTRVDWRGKGTAVMKGSATISNTASLIMNAVTIDSSAVVSLPAGTDTLLIKGAIVLKSGSILNTDRNIELTSTFTNNGGTFNSNGYTAIFSGSAQTIGGTHTTVFGVIQLGTAAATVTCTANQDFSATSIVFNGGTRSRTLILGNGISLNVTENVTINQPTGDNLTNSLSVNTGALNIGGNLVFAGTSNTSSRRAQIVTTSGSFNLVGNVTWMSNTATTTEVITTASGSLTFNNSLAMPSGSGSVKVTGMGVINFNGTVAPSLSFGGSTAPYLTTASGSTIKFAKGLTCAATGLTFAQSSTVQFVGSGIVTPTAAITFGNILIDSAVTLTAAGSVAVKNNWTNLGTFIPATYTVTFNGSGIQTISKAGGETFYRLTASTAGATLTALNNIKVTNLLTMSGHNINMNGDTLTLGNNAVATLSRSRGIVYGGVFKRWFAAAAISSGASTGLFPIGTATAYRPVAISTSTSPTTAGYVLASCTDAATVTSVSYTDNESTPIYTIANMRAILSTTGLAGGVYRLNVTYSGLSRTGSSADLKLLTYTGDAMGSFGTTAATTGSVDTPTVKRTAITLAQLNNTWVVGTKNAVNTPIRQYYHSRQTGNWNDTLNTWSYTSGGPSCNCVPDADGYVVINSGHTISVNVSAGVDYVEVKANATLKDDGIAALAINNDLILVGTGKFVNTTAWSIAGNLTLSTTSTDTVSASLTISGNVNMPTGSTLISAAGALNIQGNVILNGTLKLQGGTLNLSSVGGTISGTGNVTGSSQTLTLTNAKNIAGGSNITFGSPVDNVSVAISSGSVITSNGTVTLYGSLTGGSAASTWINAPNSTLKVSGALLSTGILNTGTGANRVIYNGTAQTIKVPSTSYYNLEISGGGVKTLASTIDIDNNLTVGRFATLNTGTAAITGLGSLRLDEGSELQMERSATGVYPELLGALDMVNGTVTVNQTGGTTILAPGIYNNLKLSGSRPCDLSGVNSIVGNLTIQGSASIIENAVLDVHGILNYNSSAASELSNDITVRGVNISSGSFSDGARTITLNGNGGWVCTGGTSTLTGSLVFAGSDTQSISGSVATQFNNLSIRNKAGIVLALSPAAPTVVKNSLLLDSGVIHTTTQNVLMLTDSATSSSGSAISYVSGPMTKTGNSDFIFPIGKDGKWRRAAVSDMQNNATVVTAEYFAEAYTDVNSVDAALAAISTSEYWDINRTVTTDSLRVTLYWENAAESNIQDCEHLTIAHYKGGSWMEESALVDSGSTCSSAGSGSVTTTGYVSSFSPFGFGDNGNGSALPVELIYFTAQVEGENVKTMWATALEISNSHFEVERSIDGVKFEKIGVVEGAGTSTSTLSYHLFDEQPVFGISYYRLKQVDYDGVYEYSKIAAVNLAKAGATVSVYPNPAHGNVNIAMRNAEGNVAVSIYNQTGIQVYSSQATANAGSTTLAIPVQDLPAGMYFVNVHTDTTDTTQKLAIQ